MLRKRWLSVALAAFLGGTATAAAQDSVGRPNEPPVARKVNLWNYAPVPAAGDSGDVYVIPPEKEPSPSGFVRVQATTAPMQTTTAPQGQVTIAPIVVSPRTLQGNPPGRVIMGSDPRAVSSGNFPVQAPPDTTEPGPGPAPAPGEGPSPGVASPAPGEGESTSAAAEEGGGYGPTPIQKVKTLQNSLKKLCGKEVPPDSTEKKDAPADTKACPPEGCPDKKDAPPPDGCADKPAEKKKDCLLIFGWADFDYTYRSIGGGNNPVAPVMNHFGNEFLNRSDGLAIAKELDAKKWDWGFNMIFIGGSDAAFLNPTEGWLRNSDLGPGGSSRFSYMFTDLNLTANIPLGDDSSFSIKAGRQTTVLGPMGALPWQRWFDSSDYA
jgi:hypothetical protein